LEWIESQTMSSVVMSPERPEAGPRILPCPVATQAQHLLAQLQFSHVGSRALARLPVESDVAVDATPA
jgi:hypothetical protein